VRPPRTLTVVAVGLAALVVLAGLFYLGSRLPLAGGDAASTPPVTVTEIVTAAPTQTPTPTPTPTTAPVVGPVAPGEHAWTELLGGECLSPYTSPWESRFTVVDCAAPHLAQLIARASLNPDPAAPYPGESAITAQLGLACTDSGVLDAVAAAPYPDIQWQASYPVSAEQWTAGVREYSCFVSRASGGTFAPGSVAVKN
jgi:hypothetical protein